MWKCLINYGKCPHLQKINLFGIRGKEQSKHSKHLHFIDLHSAFALTADFWYVFPNSFIYFQPYCEQKCNRTTWIIFFFGREAILACNLFFCHFLFKLVIVAAQKMTWRRQDSEILLKSQQIRLFYLPVWISA